MMFRFAGPIKTQRPPKETTPRKPYIDNSRKTSIIGMFSKFEVFISGTIDIPLKEIEFISSGRLFSARHCSAC